MASNSTGRPVTRTVGEVLMDFADGGNYNQAKLSEAILEVEKVRKAFESKLAKEKTDRSAKEASLKQEDVERLVREFSCTEEQAKSCLATSSGDVVACMRSLIAGDMNFEA